MPEIHLAMVILEGLDFLIRKHVNRINPDHNTLTVEILAQPIVNEYLSFRAEGKGSFREKAAFKVLSRSQLMAVNILEKKARGWLLSGRG